jgi:hypothetical protein
MSTSSVPPASRWARNRRSASSSCAGAPEAERPADEDGPVVTREVELVHWLQVQVRREVRALGLLSAGGDHVGRHVATVDVESRAQVREQEPSRSARNVERRLSTVFDEALEVPDLVRPEVVVEQRPILRDEPVVPRLRLFGHGASLRSRACPSCPSDPARDSSHPRSTASR